MNRKGVKVTVVIPAYNCGAYIGESIRSVANQTEREFEVIVVDDGSTDDTLHIASAIAAEDPRIRVISQIHSGTPSVGRNNGIRAACGEFITFLDADDLYTPHKIEHELRAFARCPELGMVFGDVVLFRDDPALEKSTGLLQELGFLKQTASLTEHIEGALYRCRPNFYNFISTKISSVNTQTVMIRRTLLLQEPTFFREDWCIGEDLDLWFRLARRVRLGYLDEVLSFARQRPGSLSRGDNEQITIGFIRAHSTNLERGRDVLSADEIEVIQSRLARQYMNLGYHYFNQGRMREARTSYRRARDLSPAHYSRAAFLKTRIPYPLVKLLKKARGTDNSTDAAISH